MKLPSEVFSIVERTERGVGGLEILAPTSESGAKRTQSGPSDSEGEMYVRAVSDFSGIVGTFEDPLRRALHFPDEGCAVAPLSIWFRGAKFLRLGLNSR